MTTVNNGIFDKNLLGPVFPVCCIPDRSLDTPVMISEDLVTFGGLGISFVRLWKTCSSR
jgi:hypothetical protein